MGGRAFAQCDPPLPTPRLPPSLYFLLRDQYIKLLSAIYTSVATPIEAPGKTSHGDIDILVSSPKLTEIKALVGDDLAYTSGSKASTGGSTVLDELRAHDSNPELLATILLLKPVKVLPIGPTKSFALAHPSMPAQYIQLDVHACDPDNFHWELFLQAHGDLWQLLGTCLRSLGMTAHPRGFAVRDAQIEVVNKKRSIIFLTKNPAEVLNFLGLDEKTYWQDGGFDTEEKMFEYVRSMRLFQKRAYKSVGLKANDRKRMAKRETFRRFVFEWVPNLPDQTASQRESECENIAEAREAVFNEALENWERRKDWVQMKELWNKEVEERSTKRLAHEAKQEM